MVYDNILETMGNTPIIRLTHMGDSESARILVKFEGLNVGGSIKTRTAYNMILEAEKMGKINKETIIVGTIRWPALAKLNAYKNIAGAIPNEMISDNESIFLPKPYSSTLLVLRATKPSAESNNNENIIKIAAR